MAQIFYLGFVKKHETLLLETALVQTEIVYTEFAPALEKISKPEPGNIEDFIGVLQDKLDDKLENNPPDAPSLGDIFLQ
jgi:hypothetical protein